MRGCYSEVDDLLLNELGSTEVREQASSSVANRGADRHVLERWRKELEIKDLIRCVTATGQGTLDRSRRAQSGGRFGELGGAWKLPSMGRGDGLTGRGNNLRLDDQSQVSTRSTRLIGDGARGPSALTVFRSGSH